LIDFEIIWNILSREYIIEHYYLKSPPELINEKPKIVSFTGVVHADGLYYFRGCRIPGGNTNAIIFTGKCS
jgi:hypothetical protein